MKKIFIAMVIFAAVFSAVLRADENSSCAQGLLRNESAEYIINYKQGVKADKVSWKENFDAETLLVFLFETPDEIHAEVVAAVKKTDVSKIKITDVKVLVKDKQNKATVEFFRNGKVKVTEKGKVTWMTFEQMLALSRISSDDPYRLYAVAHYTDGKTKTKKMGSYETASQAEQMKREYQSVENMTELFEWAYTAAGGKKEVSRIELVIKSN